MKKISNLLIAVFMSFFLVGCFDETSCDNTEVKEVIFEIFSDPASFKPTGMLSLIPFYSPFSEIIFLKSKQLSGLQKNSESIILRKIDELNFDPSDHVGIKKAYDFFWAELNAEISKLKSAYYSAWLNVKFELEDIILIKKSESSSALECKAKLKVSLDNWGRFDSFIKYLIETDTDGKIHVSILDFQYDQKSFSNNQEENLSAATSEKESIQKPQPAKPNYEKFNKWFVDKVAEQEKLHKDVSSK